MNQANFLLCYKVRTTLWSWLQPSKNNCVPTELDVSISAFDWCLHWVSVVRDLAARDAAMQWGKVLFTFCTRVLYRSSHDHHRAFVCLPFIHFISLLNYLFYTSLCGVSSSPVHFHFLKHLLDHIKVSKSRNNYVDL